MNLKANLTNDDIIKALKDWAEKVNHAVYFEVNENGAKELYENLLNAICLIYRQKAEIEKLTYQVNHLKKYDEERDIRLHERLTATARAEATKEFAEMIKDRYPNKYVVWGGGAYGITFENFIDNLVKEMAGEDK